MKRKCLLSSGLLKKSLLVALAIGALNVPAYAKTTSVNELNSPYAFTPAVSKSKDVLKSDSYAYRALQYLYEKYGAFVDLPKDKFKGTEPLSRNEAALILVNILGKVQKNQVQLNEADQQRVESITDQLKDEVGALTARVAKVESSVSSLQDNVNTLEGRISNIEETESKTGSITFGEKFRVGGMFRGHFESSLQKRNTDNATGTFSMPVAMLTLSGKPSEKTDYFVMLNAGYKGLGLSDPNSIIDRAFVQTSIIPHHKLTFGKQVVPVSEMGNKYYSQYETADFFPQIGYFGIIREPGVKLSGDYKYLNYQTGLFANTVANTNNAGVSYVARAGLKPLADKPQYGDMEFGGSYMHANKNTAFSYKSVLSDSVHSYLPDRNTNLYTAYVKYKYKKFDLISEYVHQTNVLDVTSLTSINPFESLNPIFMALSGGTISLPATNVRTTDINGWYIQGLYHLTPKIDLVGRFDTLGTKARSAGVGQQYLAGVNYYFKYPNLKLLADYIVQDYRGSKLNHKFMVQTQFLF